MFSVIFILCCTAFLVYRLKRGKPTNVHLNPVAAKAEIVDRFIEIEAMPKGRQKQQAFKQWQQLYGELKQQKKLQR